MSRTDLVLEGAIRPNHLLEDVLAHVGVDGAEGVVQQVDVGVLVHGTSQTHALLLPTTQVDALRGVERDRQTDEY